MPLAQPAHSSAKEKEHRQAHRDRDQRALGLMDHDLVDHHLGANRRGEADELDEERGEEHVAPDALVPEELLPEPAEAEFRRRRRAVLGGRLLRRLVPHEEHVDVELLLERLNRRGLRRLAAGDEVEQPLGVALDEERRLHRFACEKGKTGKHASRQLPFARPEPERAQRLDQLPDRMRRRKFLQ